MRAQSISAPTAHPKASDAPAKWPELNFWQAYGWQARLDDAAFLRDDRN